MATPAVGWCADAMRTFFFEIDLTLASAARLRLEKKQAWPKPSVWRVGAPVQIGGNCRSR